MKIQRHIRAWNAVFNVSWIVFGLILGGLMLIVSQWFLVLLIALFLVGAYCQSALRCPKCEHRVLIRRSNFLGAYSTPFAPAECPKCGEPL